MPSGLSVPCVAEIGEKLDCAAFTHSDTAFDLTDLQTCSSPTGRLNGSTKYHPSTNTQLPMLRTFASRPGNPMPAA